MQPTVMRRLPSLVNTGAWLLTLLSFTSGFSSKLDLSWRAKWRDIVTKLNFPKIDTFDHCCPQREEAWINRFSGDAPYRGNRYWNDRKIKYDDFERTENFDLKRKKSVFTNKTIDTNLYISRLLQIRGLLKCKRDRECYYQLAKSSFYVSPIAQTKLNVNEMNSSIPLSPTPSKRKWVRSYFRNVFVHGKDDRIRIGPILLRKFPFSNMVRLSTGCTGTLMTPYHVLTAAHCVHNGREFRNKLEMLKVEVPDTIGVRLYYIEKIGIPEKWLNPQSRTDRRAFYDFAVVRLSYGVHGRKKFLPLAVPTQEVLHQKLQFLGFPLDSFGLWRSVCSANSNKALMDGNLILTRCDSAIGNSGASVLAGDSRSGHKIIGVLSSTMPIGRTPHYSRYNIVTALTWSKLHNICDEIGQIGVDHGVCPSSEMIPKSRRFQHKNKVIPFFG